ncbi:MAG: aldo/keto reductase [Oligoflexales bacterium]
MESLHHLKRPFGSLDYQISPLGLGTVKFGRNLHIKNACGDGQPLPSTAVCTTLLEKALELGVNFIDTAPAYGAAEEALGKIISPSIRKNIIITTKVGEFFDTRTGTSQHHFDRKTTTASIEASFQNLNTDYLDFIFVHCSHNDLENLNNTDVLPTLARFKEKGLIRGFGASVYTQQAAQYALNHTDGLMITYNLNDSQHRTTLQKAYELKKAVVIKKGFLQGHLGEKGPEPALKHILQQPIHSIVCGTLNPDHLAQNADITARLIRGYR